MTRTNKWLGILAAMVMAGSASAITVDGQWYDWFSYGGTSSSNWNQGSASGSLPVSTAIRYQNDSDDDAYGGQNYDIEQLFYLYEDLDPNAYTGGTLYVGMVTGYEPTNTTYRAGDLFIDLGYAGGAHTYDLAIATGVESSSRFGDVWSNSGWSTSGVSIPSHSGSNPYRVKDTLAGATYYTNASIDWDYENGSGDRHNFLEIGLVLNGAMEELIALNGIGLHWTMACGNDNINVYDSNPLSTIPPPPPPLDPVPEPATLVLLGMGALGLALKHRRTAC